MFLTSCTPTPSGDAELKKGVIEVSASVSPITDLVASVGGRRVRVSGLIPEGSDSHTFEPAPVVVRKLISSRLIFVNGLGLEEPLIRLARARTKQARLVELGAAIPRDEWVFDDWFEEQGGQPNPHLWTSPLYAKVFVEQIAARLSEQDPDGSSYYRQNSRRMLARLDVLDKAIRSATESIPPERRKLITYHDSFPYFARHYGWEVIAAIQPADLTEPSARDVALIIQQIQTEKVPAIFGSEVFPSETLEMIARRSGARYVDSLRDDDLPGESGDADHTYIGLIRFDVSTIVRAMGGDTRALTGIDASALHEGNASYA